MNAPVASIGVSLRNILLPTDFSACSETALTYGAGLARRFDTTLYTVTVVPQEVTDYVQPPDPFYWRHTAEKKMANVAGLDLLQGIRHREFVKEGPVPETLSDMINCLEIDLIVLGTHGRGGVKKFIFGSVAEQMVNSVPCPVLTIGPRVRRLTAPRVRLQRILYLTDLLHCSAKALSYAVWLAGEDHGQLILLHVLKSPSALPAGSQPAEVEAARISLAQLLPVEKRSSVGADCIVEAGVPGEQILKIAEKQCADLIVMGPHHTVFARLSAHLPWITTHEVICYAGCPVLTVPE